MITKDQAMKACFAVLCGMLAAKVIAAASFLGHATVLERTRFVAGVSLFGAAASVMVYMILNERGRPEGRPKL